MKKNILVLTGSPRKGGNSDLLADAFIAGALKAGHEVTKHETATKKINGCRACKTCFSKGYACSYNDDFNELAPLMETADIIVFATPLYSYSFSSYIKVVLEKLYSFIIGKIPMNIKECILLVCGADGIKSFDGIIKQYELMTFGQKWKDAGRIIVPGVNNIGDIKNTDALARAEKLGLSIT